MEKWALTALADGYLAHARRSSGRGSRHTSRGSPGSRMRTSLVALVGGRSLDSGPRNTGTTMQVLRGRVHLATADRTVTCSAGELLIVPPTRFTATAVEDSVVLLTTAAPEYAVADRMVDDGRRYARIPGERERSP
jgi:hypothetical protein